MADTTNCAYEYTVKRGDSFYLISRRLGVPLRELIAANPTIHPARLTVGDVLCIPTDDVHHKAECDNTTQNGTQNGAAGTEDTPDGNGETGGTAEPENGEAQDGQNGQSNSQVDLETLCPPNRRVTVQEGQTAGDLQLRYGLSLHTLETANPTANLDELKAGETLCIPALNLPCELPATLTLEEHETLESVAVAYNLPIASLLRANPCLAPEDFTQGVTIRLPQ